MKKIYHLSTCDTCKRILKELEPSKSYTLQDLKSEPVTPDQLNELYTLSGSYEALFNKRARLYKERDLKTKNLSENDYKALLLEHYTFLKRPVIRIDDEVFIGNSKKTIQEAKSRMLDE
ncbi:arsenate reductase family protein [Aquimarina intermedia]|uniref:Arsenate reductase-like glutaredoxin family protein n=1 Tax=Aquimarina intermedia TaxID=350814 RepID=A0A5S5CCY9_9FLAO|nr:ArsC/Spx/MgsR family protein [Aquimarina intermedia]TYP76220.1 arsenate reductase-like glutaredoxin family protein [Aquimarina intermedia]